MANRLADQWPSQQATIGFWERLLADGSKEKTLLDRQFSYFYRRSLGFLSAGLKGSEHALLEDSLLQYLIGLGRIEVWSGQLNAVDILPLPATEAITNQLLVLAEVDLAALAIVMQLLLLHVWPTTVLLSILATGSDRESQSDLVRYLEATSHLTKLLDSSRMDRVELSDQRLRRILVESMLLLETGELFARELVAAAR